MNGRKIPVVKDSRQLSVGLDFTFRQSKWVARWADFLPAECLKLVLEQLGQPVIRLLTERTANWMESADRQRVPRRQIPPKVSRRGLLEESDQKAGNSA